MADELILFGRLPSYVRPLSTRLGVGEVELPVDPAAVERFLAKCAPVDDQGHLCRGHALRLLGFDADAISQGAGESWWTALAVAAR